jgi:hypothetical protein
LGLFRTCIVMRMKGVRSLREMTRILDTDLRLRRLCLIKPREAAYPRSVLSRFIRKVGKDKLTRIVEEKVVKLLKRNGTKEVDSLFDASFIKAWSTRDPLDNQKGYSDEDARVGRAGRSFGLGYKLHLSIDSKTMLPLACVFASANQNEQKHSLNMLEKTKLVLKQSAAKLKTVIGDSQYSDGKLRNAGTEAVIPYRANQKRDIKGLLRVDKKFRAYGPEDQIREYHKRPHIEAVYSFLKTQYSLTINKVRGIKNVASYGLYSILCLVLNREAAENLGRPDKAVSPTYFNT